jgi:putative addiction module component (TIGR02574 family)
MSSHTVVNPKVIDEIKNLNVLDKLEIVEDIWQSIVTSNEKLPVSSLHKKDLDQRLKEYQNNPDDGSTWEEAKKRIDSKI